MFLHETGEDDDSFSRQDLSSMNAVSTQHPTPSTNAMPSSSKPSHQAPIAQPQVSTKQVPPNTTVITQSMARQDSKDELMSRSDSGDGSALPNTANWAKNPPVQLSRRSSIIPSRSTPSPRVSGAKMPIHVADNQTTKDLRVANVIHEVELLPVQGAADSPLPLEDRDRKKKTPRVANPPIPLISLERAVNRVLNSTFKWSLDRSLFDEETLSIIDNYPPLIDPNGGAIRHAMKVKQDQEKAKADENIRNKIQATSNAEDDDILASGSLQLGGEPETQDTVGDAVGQYGNGRHSSRLHRAFVTSTGLGQPFDGQGSFTADFSNLAFGGRSLTPQQQQQQQLSLLKSSNQHEVLVDQSQRGISSNTSQHHPQLSNPFQSQSQHLGSLSGHARQTSRYNFANDSDSNAGADKSSASAQLVAHQSAMMPFNQQKAFVGLPSQPSPHTSFYSGVQGPPPGLKSSGTPPISGGGMFGQGHGFASAMGGSLAFGSGNSGGKTSNDDLMRDLLRGRNTVGNGMGVEAGKRKFMFPSFLQKPMTTTSTPAPGLPSPLYGQYSGVFNGYQDQGPMKQKKKGKKHRHANTSSSGGGGIVDLADPSIVQARMHQGSTGQGQYGGIQGQGGYTTHNVMYGSGFGSRW